AVWGGWAGRGLPRPGRQPVRHDGDGLLLPRDRERLVRARPARAPPAGVHADRRRARPAPDLRPLEDVLAADDAAPPGASPSVGPDARRRDAYVRPAAASRRRHRAL